MVNDDLRLSPDSRKYKPQQEGDEGASWATANQKR